MKPSLSESGNVFFYVLLAIVLIGLVTVAMRSGDEGGNIDKETITINATQVRQYASELERAVAFIMRDGISESDIRFAHPDTADYGDINDSPNRQVFHQSGGGAEYRTPVSDISSASQWEFYGNTHLPGVGTSEPELIALLPLVNQAFCEKINLMNGYDAGVQPAENGDCNINDTSLRFTSASQFQDGAANTVDSTDFLQPAMQGCIQCSTGYHFFHVLLAR